MKSQIALFLSALMAFAPSVALSADTNLTTDRVKIGTKSTTQKELVFDMNAGTANPRLKSTTSGLQFSNDGSTFRDIGSGSGGGSGINLLVNGDAESGTNNVTASGGTFTTTSTAANVGNGTKSFSWDASATSQTLTWAAVTPVGQLVGKECSAELYYSGGDENLVAEVRDAATNVLVSQTLAARTSYGPIQMGFPCPASGTMELRLRSTANAAIIYIDSVKLGSLDYVNISQAKLFGRILWAGGSCVWSTTTTASSSAFPVDADCSASQLAGTALEPTTKIPGIRFPSMPAGEYHVIANSTFIKGAGAVATGYLRFNDGTFATPVQPVSSETTAASVIATINGRLNYTEPKGDTTIQIFGNTTNAAAALSISPGTTSLEILVYYFPPTTEQAVRVGTEAWRVDANISGTAPSLGTAAVTTYAEVASASLTMANNPGFGTTNASIPCTGGNVATGTTCSAGSEVVGVNFDVPRAGAVLACVSFSHFTDITYAGVDTLVQTAFQIVETANNSSTILQEGRSRVVSSDNMVIGFTSSSSRQSKSFPHRLCGTFNFASAGNKTLRLMYEQGVSGTVNNSQVIADANSTVGQRDIHWEVYPLTQGVPQPVILNSVSTNSANAERLERVIIGGASNITNCTASPCTTYAESGDWVTSVTRTTTGSYTINTTSAFSGDHVCVCSGRDSATAGDVRFCSVVPSTTPTAINVRTWSATNVLADAHVNVICMGAK